jgi:hypothetical protein
MTLVLASSLLLFAYHFPSTFPLVPDFGFRQKAMSHRGTFVFEPFLSPLGYRTFEIYCSKEKEEIEEHKREAEEELEREKQNFPLSYDFVAATGSDSSSTSSFYDSSSSTERSGSCTLENPRMIVVVSEENGSVTLVDKANKNRVYTNLNEILFSNERGHSYASSSERDQAPKIHKILLFQSEEKVTKGIFSSCRVSMDVSFTHRMKNTTLELFYLLPRHANRVSKLLFSSCLLFFFDFLYFVSWKFDLHLKTPIKTFVFVLPSLEDLLLE